MKRKKKKEIEHRAIACENLASKKLHAQQGKFPEVEDSEVFSNNAVH